jgi:hypothetical protein
MEQKGLTVKELFELLKKVVDDGKGDYKVKLDVGEWWVDLETIKVIDYVLNNEAYTVNLLS